MCDQAVMKCYPFYTYCNNPKCWNRQAWANNVDPDQTLQNMWVLILIYIVFHLSGNINDASRCSKK